tara:strand:- start:2108 stop:2653 length:546 start_codon:yes stop_codon:yes gene_type:complete
MIEAQKELERVTTSTDYLHWSQDKEENKSSYLCSLFCIQDKELIEDNVWQVSFYTPKKDTITTFTLPVDKRKKAELLSKDSKIFKRPGEVVGELKLKKVKLNDAKALNTAKEFLKENHPSEKVLKEILLLQQNKELQKTIWNITLMTTTLNIFNAKINASTGEVIDHYLRSAMDLRKEMQK